MKQPRGFIALISVIIISFVLLVVVLSFAQYGIMNRFLLLDLERKSASENLAEGCVAVGIIALVNDPLFEVTDRYVPVGAGQCKLTITPLGGGQSTIQASASSTGATTNFHVVIIAATGAIVSKEELPNF